MTSTPPGLRLKKGDYGPRCAVCSSFDGSAKCIRYDALVGPQWTCNSFVSVFADGKRQYAEL